MNLTMRTFSTDVMPDESECSRKIDIGEGGRVIIWDSLFTPDELAEIEEVLLETIKDHGVNDVTRMFGKTFTNNGRRVVEMASDPNFEYRYAGKVVKSIEFPERIRDLVLPKMTRVFGLSSADTLWGHLVYYPTPDCKLDWHDDGEEGINPHLIVSITFLEHPKIGARRFRVRLKSSFPQKKSKPIKNRELPLKKQKLDFGK